MMFISSLMVISYLCMTLTPEVQGHREISSSQVTTSGDVELTIARSPRVHSKLDADQRQTIVDIHNEIRSQQQAADMNRLSWNDDLADMSQQWADRCDFRHKQPHFESALIRYDQIGQTMVAMEAEFNPVTVLQSWKEEKAYFKTNAIQCNNPNCTKLMQLLWSGTKEVGCGITLCPELQHTELSNASFFVCNYGPTRRPLEKSIYKKGRACSQCRSNQGWCQNGLCIDNCDSDRQDCVCALECQHCSKQISSNCTCLCEAGWVGPECSEECIEKSGNCNDSPGWPPNWCDLNMVYELCPVMCGRCEVAENTEEMVCPTVEGKPVVGPENKGIITYASIITQHVFLAVAFLAKPF